MKIKDVLKSNKDLFLFFILTYIDKGLYFILPMAVLSLTKDSIIYNKVEYICSISNIIVPFASFVSCYSLFGYKEADDKNKFIDDYRFYSSIVTLMGGLICLVISNLLLFAGIKSLESITFYLTIRTMFYVFIKHINYYYRLKDTPIKSLLYSIFVNLFSLTALVICYLGHKNKFVIGCFFVPELSVIFFEIYCIIHQRKKKHSMLGFGKFILSSMKFAWPIVINSTVVAFVANYGKVYAYNFLTNFEMYELSFLLRIVMIIEMAHASLIAFFSKEVYLKGFTKKFIITYTTIIIFVVIGVTGVMYLYNLFFTDQSIPLDGTFILIITYSLLHMVGAVIEMDYGRHNKNTYIFILSTVSCCVYLFMIFVVGIKNIYTISAYMVIYMLLYVVLLASIRKKVIKIS